MNMARIKLVPAEQPAEPARKRQRKARFDYSRFIPPHIKRLSPSDLSKPKPQEGDVQITSGGTFVFAGGEWKARS